MFELFLSSFNSVSYFFLIVLVGMVLRRALHVEHKQIKIINDVFFYVMLPCILFRSIITCDLRDLATNPLLYLCGALNYVIAALLLVLIVPRFIKDRRKIGGFITPTFRGNCILVGLPVCMELFGEANSAPIVIMLMVVAPVMNILAMTTLAPYSSTKTKLTAGDIVLIVLKNPAIVGILVGLTFSLLQLELPDLCMKVVNQFSDCSTPIAMLVLGMGFELKSLSSDKKLVFIAVFLKNIFFPVLFTIPAVLLGFRGPELGAIALFQAMPSAVNSSIVAESMGCDGHLAGEITLVSTALSLITLVAAIMSLSGLGWI